jgi:hypothetical protein
MIPCFSELHFRKLLQTHVYVNMFSCSVFLFCIFQINLSFVNIIFKSNELATKCDTNYTSSGKLYSQETYKDFHPNVLHKSQLLHNLFLVFGMLYSSTCKYGCCFLFSLLNSVASVRKQIIVTERPQLVGEVSANFFAEKTSLLQIFKYRQIMNRRAAAKFHPTKGPATVAVTLKDLQTQLYTWRWPVGPKHVVYLNVCNNDKSTN